MDLRLFHPKDNPAKKYKRLDYPNSRTGLFACRLLEFVGWYTSNVKHRLLGHYRLFQIYKRRRFNSLSAPHPVQGYILQYRSSYWIKYYWYLVISRFPSMFRPEPGIEMYMINKMLIGQRADILSEFLTAAEIDFEPAFEKALQQINSPEFINPPTITKTQETTIKEIIIREPVLPVKELAGKGKGVFSKHQVLIFLDLLAQTAPIEHLPITKPERHLSIAQFLQALTGKSAETWLEELQHYNTNDLYAFHTETERSNLIGTLTNLSDITHSAGLRAVSTKARAKIRKLRQQP